MMAGLHRDLAPREAQVPPLSVASLGMVLYIPYTFGEQFTTITTEAPGAAEHTHTE